MTERSIHTELNQYHLGLWYSAYRFIISACLLLVFLLTYPQLNAEYAYPRLYLYVLTAYLVLTSIQFMSLKTLKVYIANQLLMLFVVDVISLSLLTLATDGPNLHLSLLFVITIFAASLLLDAKKALIVTLVAVICVVYQLFLGSILEFTSLKNLTNSAILAFLFCVVYGSAQVAVRRFQLMENLNFHNLSNYIACKILTAISWSRLIQAI